MCFVIFSTCLKIVDFCVQYASWFLSLINMQSSIFFSVAITVFRMSTYLKKITRVVFSETVMPTYFWTENSLMETSSSSTTNLEWLVCQTFRPSLPMHVFSRANGSMKWCWDRKVSCKSDGAPLSVSSRRKRASETLPIRMRTTATEPENGTWIRRNTESHGARVMSFRARLIVTRAKLGSIGMGSIWEWPMIT